MDILSVFLQAQPNAGANSWSFWIMMIVIFAIMYFFMIRPQNKKQKEINNFRSSLQVGQEVVTAGGIYGKIKDVEVTFVVLEIANGVNIKIDKNSIYAKPEPSVR